MSNKDEFNRIAGLVLKKLDDEFPVGVSLHAKDFVDENSESERTVFYYTLHFLRSEGLLTFEAATIDGSYVGEVLLTGKGLAVLNAVPELLQEKAEVTTFRQKIVDALKTSSKETLKITMSQLIQAVVKGQWQLPNITG